MKYNDFLMQHHFYLKTDFALSVTHLNCRVCFVL